MSVYTWFYLLIVVAVISLITGIVFSVLDLKKPQETWEKISFITDAALFIIFLLSSGGAVYVYLLIQKQIEFFS
ncbi:hypothetical protein D920_00075 [Enterococcus faecalis 13-SD-W-01]|nr:hypothetical protein D920_00075 [Enterococcus faecalis 13-SD-W-01]